MNCNILLSALFFVCMLCAARAQTNSTTPEVSPGIHLPTSATLSVLELNAGVAKLVNLHATEISLNHHAGSNYARAQVLGNQHRTVDLEGSTASVMIESRQPAFYFRLPLENPDIARSQITLIRLKSSKERRVVLDFSNNVFGGGQKRNVDIISVSKTDIEDGFLKITPVAELSAGEYGLMFLPKDPSLFDELIYDFSIGPNATKAAGN